jgi:hypothetical protein
MRPFVVLAIGAVFTPVTAKLEPEPVPLVVEAANE